MILEFVESFVLSPLEALVGGISNVFNIYSKTNLNSLIFREFE